MPAELPEHIQDRLGSYLSLADHALTTAKARALRPHDVTVPQYVTLMALHLLPSQSAAQLARTLSLAPQTLAGILGNLESKGLVLREPSPAHTRVLLVSLTDAGTRRALAADEAARKVEQAIADALTPEAWAQARDALVTVIDALEQADGTEDE